MSQDNININVTENIDNVNIVTSEVVEVVDLNLFPTTEDVTINVTEDIIQVNINKFDGSSVTKTSDLINDGEDGVNPFITLSDVDLSSKLDKDFSSLQNATTPLSGSEELAIIQDGETKKVAVSDALASKADSANVEEIFDAKGYGNWGQADNSTAEEVLRVIDVPAGYYTSTDSMSMLIRLQKGSSSGNMTLRVRVGVNGNTSDSLISTTTVAAGGNSPSIVMQRNQIVFDDSNIYFPSSLQSLNTDITSGSYGSYSNVSLNTADNWKITITCQTDNNSQNIILRHYKITKFKNK